MGDIRRLVISDASEYNLQLFFSLPKRLFTDLHGLVIERVESVIGDILSDGQLINLKQFSFQSKSVQVLVI